MKPYFFIVISILIVMTNVDGSLQQASTSTQISSAPVTSDQTTTPPNGNNTGNMTSSSNAAVTSDQTTTPPSGNNTGNMTSSSNAAVTSDQTTTPPNGNNTGNMTSSSNATVTSDQTTTPPNGNNTGNMTSSSNAAVTSDQTTTPPNGNNTGNMTSSSNATVTSDQTTTPPNGNNTGNMTSSSNAAVTSDQTTTPPNGNTTGNVTSSSNATVTSDQTTTPPNGNTTGNVTSSSNATVTSDQTTTAPPNGNTTGNMTSSSNATVTSDQTTTPSNDNTTGNMTSSSNATVTSDQTTTPPDGNTTGNVTSSSNATVTSDQTTTPPNGNTTGNVTSSSNATVTSDQTTTPPNGNTTGNVTSSSNATVASDQTTTPHDTVTSDNTMPATKDDTTPTPAPKFCDSSPCQNNGACFNDKCVCMEGWEGSSCEMDVDECKINNICGDNSKCTNKNGTYGCACTNGFKMLNKKCTKIFMLPLDATKPSQDRVTGDTNTLGPIEFPIDFPYFENTFKNVYAYVDGYVSMGKEYVLNHSPRNWPDYPSLIGVYWSDLDLNKKSSGLYVHQESRADNTSFSGPILEFVETYLKATVEYKNFTPLAAVAFTWMDATPYPTKEYPNDITKAQVILSTDGVYSFAIRNYDTTWPIEGEERRHSVSFNYTGTGGKNVLTFDEPGAGNGGRIITPLFSCSGVSNKAFQCRKSITELKIDNLTLPACPCVSGQAKLDFFFTEVMGTSCYENIFKVDGWKQMCCYDGSGVLEKNNMRAKYPTNEDEELGKTYETCCAEDSILCTWFYTKFPSDTCNKYKPFEISGGFGDPHLENFNKEQFSFNGLGEYTLFKIGSMEFQGKTKASTDANTTFFSAFALKCDEKTSYVIEKDPDSNNIKGNWTDETKKYQNFFEKQINGSLKVNFFSLSSGGAEITVELEKSQALSFIVTNQFKGQLEGMMVKPQKPFRDMTGSEVHTFVENWKVGAYNKSLFPHANESEWKKSFDSPEFFEPLKPPTTPEKVLAEITNDTKHETANRTCEGNLFCLQDYLARGDLNRTLDIVKSSKELQEKIKERDDSNEKNKPAVFNGDLNNVRLNRSTHSLQLQTDRTDVDFSTSGNLAGLTLETNGIISINLTAHIEHLRKETYPSILIFNANTSSGVLTEYKPDMYLCLCEMDEQCTPNSNTVNNGGTKDGNVHNLGCNCPATTTGQHCDKKVDVCEKCQYSKHCNETKEQPCGCPTGFGINIGTGAVKCYEINECETNNGGCDQICNNTVGSRKCSCNSGYTPNGTECHDILECADSNLNGCENYQQCVELPGTHRCECFSGHYGSTCFKGNFFRPLTAEFRYDWNSDLLNKSSKMFISLKKEFEQNAMEIFKNGSNSQYDENNSGIVVSKFEKSGNRTKRALGKDHVVAQALLISSVKIDESDVEAFTKGVLDGTQPGNVFFLSFKSDIFNNTCVPDPCDPDTTDSCKNDDSDITCDCKYGYKKIIGNKFQCEDVNECSASNSRVCEKEDCTNFEGSYFCKCHMGNYWNNDTKKCTDPCIGREDYCKHGDCIPQGNNDKVHCRCSYGWEGDDCDDEDGEATDKKIAIICVSVILGVLCLFLLIIIVAMYLKFKRNYNDFESVTAESVRETSIYEHSRHIPRPHLIKDNDEGDRLNRLENVYQSVDAPGKKNTYTTYDNPSYDSLSEKL